MNDRLIPDLYRSEYSRLIALLVKKFRFDSIEIAEDIVGETFLKATTTWGLKGVPNNPKAWLYQVAKNQALDHFRRQQNYQDNIHPELQSEASFQKIEALTFSEADIGDSQLRMIFVVCNPVIPPEAQIALALRILCGFSIPEIASALLSRQDTINKRLHRAKKKLQTQDRTLLDVEGTVFEERLHAVQTVLYLLFNEGYFSSHSNEHIRKDLCIEAMRLLHLLLDFPVTNRPTTNALMALFCFHASRFEARTKSDGSPVLYEDQDQSLWDDELINKGIEFLQMASKGNQLSKFHLEAAIAFCHTHKAYSSLEYGQEKWNRILQLYNLLLQLEYSPTAALNRTYALYKVHGAEKALQEAHKIDLKEHYLYHSLLAEIQTELDHSLAIEHWQNALNLAKNERDKIFIRKKLEVLLLQ